MQRAGSRTEGGAHHGPAVSPKHGEGYSLEGFGGRRPDAQERLRSSVSAPTPVQAKLGRTDQERLSLLVKDFG